MPISENIRKIRKQKGYTQKQLAELSGIATITLQQYELDKREPKIDQLIKIANALNVNINSLLDSIDSPALRAMQQVNSPFYDDYQQLLLSKDIKLTEADVELIKNFHKLNDSGQNRLLEYLADILKIDSYNKGTP